MPQELKIEGLSDPGCRRPSAHMKNGKTDAVGCSKVANGTLDAFSLTLGR